MSMTIVFFLDIFLPIGLNHKPLKQKEIIIRSLGLIREKQLKLAINSIPGTRILITERERSFLVKSR